MVRRKTLTKRMVKNLESEIAILQKLTSPHVVSLIDLQKTTNNYYIFLEFCNGGDLNNLVELRKRIDERSARILTSQIVHGLYDLFKSRAIHRDIKLANILLHFPQQNGKKQQTEAFLEKVDLSTTPVEVRIADLGFAKTLEEEDMTKTQCGTPLNMAPEIMNG